MNRASMRVICPFLLASADSGGVVYGRDFAIEVHLFGCMVVGRFAVWPTRCKYVQKKPNAMH